MFRLQLYYKRKLLAVLLPCSASCKPPHKHKQIRHTAFSLNRERYTRCARVWKRPCERANEMLKKGEVTCSHKDGTQQHQHRAAAKNKHCLKARVRQKEQETLLSPHCGYYWRMFDSSSLTPPSQSISPDISVTHRGCRGFYATPCAPLRIPH